MRKWILPLIIIAALAASGFFGYRTWSQRQQENTVSQYQTSVIGFGSLTASIGATGTVRSYQSAVLTWETAGTVETVHVNVGDAVQPGDILAELDPGSVPQNVILARAELVNAQKALDDLLNQQAARLLALQSVQTSQAALIEAESLLDEFETQAYQDKIDQAREDMIDAREELEEAQDDFDQYKDFDPENQTRKNAQEDLDEAQLAYDEAVRALDLLILDQDMARTALDLAIARLADAQREYERIQDGPHPDDVAALEARILATQATLDQVKLVAPFGGNVTAIDVLPGDQVAPGTADFRIDDLSQLVVDVRISEVDVNRIFIGQPVNLTFDAILNQEYQGTVTEVASVGAPVQGVVEFLVSVQLSNPDEAVRPGMTAGANIIVNQLESVLLIPNRAVRLSNGQRVVYVLQDGQLEMVKITLGASSETNSEVVDGDLQAGDVVVLNPPQVFDSDGPPPFVNR